MIVISAYNKTEFEPTKLSVCDANVLKLIKILNPDILLYKVFDEETEENTYYDCNLVKMDSHKFLVLNRHRTIHIALGVSL